MLRFGAMADVAELVAGLDPVADPSRIVDQTAAADGEKCSHIQDCGTASG